MLTASSGSFNGMLQGAMSLTMIGPGYAGPERRPARHSVGTTNIEGGTLALYASNALGTSTVLVSNGSLLVGDGVSSLTNATTLDNGTSLVKGVGSIGSIFSGNVSLGGGAGSSATIANLGGGSFTLAGSIDKSDTKLVFGGGLGNGPIVVSGVITSNYAAPGSFDSDTIVNGPSVTFTNGNTYNGPTYIYGGGTLSDGADNTLPTDTTLTLGETANNTTGTYNLNGTTRLWRQFTPPERHTRFGSGKRSQHGYREFHLDGEPPPATTTTTACYGGSRRT